MEKNTRKTIYLVNAAGRDFRDDFVATCEKHELGCMPIGLSDCLFHIKGSTVKLYNDRAIIDPAESYFFIRMKGHDCYFCYLLTEFLTQQQVKFSDPINRTHTRSEGKIAQLIRLAPQGIPFPESFICRRYSLHLHKDLIFNTVGFPCVVKRSGRRGEAVWLVNSEEELIKKFDEQPYEVHIVQKYIPNEYDLRVIVFEDQVIGAMTRSSADGFANTGYEAMLKETNITAEERQLAVDVAQKAGVDFGGVDIVRTDEGLMIWEINKTPQLDRFIPATGIDVLDKLVAHIKHKYY